MCFFFVNVVLLFWDSDFLSFVLLTESVWLLFSSHLCLLNILKDHNAIEMVVWSYDHLWKWMSCMNSFLENQFILIVFHCFNPLVWVETDGPQLPSWPTMGCYLFRLDTPLELACSRWIPFEGALHTALEFMLGMAQEKQMKQSWHLLNIRVNIWPQWSRGLPRPDDIFYSLERIYIPLSTLIWVHFFVIVLVVLLTVIFGLEDHTRSILFHISPLFHSVLQAVYDSKLLE